MLLLAQSNKAGRLVPAGRTASRARRAEAGFSLVELLLVVGLILLLASAMVFNFSSLLRANKLEEGTTRLETLMRFARAQAANSGRKVQLVFGGEATNAPAAATGEVRATWERDPLGQPGCFSDMAEGQWHLQQINDLVQVESVKLVDASGADPAASACSDETDEEEMNSTAAKPMLPSLFIRTDRAIRPRSSSRRARRKKINGWQCGWSELRGRFRTNCSARPWRSPGMSQACSSALTRSSETVPDETPPSSCRMRRLGWPALAPSRTPPVRFRRLRDQLSERLTAWTTASKDRSSCLPAGVSDQMRFVSTPRCVLSLPRPCRLGMQRGAVLLEVVLALLLFVAAAAILTSGLSSSIDALERLRLHTHAADLAVSVLSEFQMGIKTLASNGPQPFEAPLEGWTWELASAPLQANSDETNQFQRIEVIIRHEDPGLVYRLDQVLRLDQASSPTGSRSIGIKSF